MSHETFLRQAIALAEVNAAEGGRPFGAVIVRGGEVLGTGVNGILRNGDPTSHAELEAIRAAARALGGPRLTDCVIYASGQPCPMCLAAMQLCGVSAAYYALSNAEAEPFGLSTAKVYAALRDPAAGPIPFIHHPVEGAVALYQAWRDA